MPAADSFERTTVIDLEEHASLDPAYSIAAASRSSDAYYALDSSADEPKSKRRKIERACDFCRRRKTKCDGPRMQHNVCSNCLQTNRSCTYLETSKPRGPPKAYVVALEDRVEKMQALLKRLRPEADFTPELGPPVIRDSWKTDASEIASSSQPEAVQTAQAPATSGARGHTLLPFATAIPPPGCTFDGQPSAFSLQAQSGASRARHRRSRRQLRPPRTATGSGESPSSNVNDTSSGSSISDTDEEESAVELSLVQGMTQLTLRGLRPTHVTGQQPIDGQWRFHGKASSFKLINATRELKQRHMDECVGNNPRQSPDMPPSNEQLVRFAPRRRQYWESLPWEISFEGADRSTTPSFIMSHFPPLDLANSLVELFFARNNSLFPLLHRPTFDRQWNDRLYETDMWYAGVCMAMFSVASRWSDDPRILPDEVAEKAPPKSESDDAWALAGWKYVDVALDVHRRRRSLFLPTNLFEVQTLVLMAMYFRGTVAHAESWTLISIGIRKAQDVGAHRRKVYGRKPTVEEELWKRAIWHLIVIDRLGSVLVGRPCCAREEDFDLDWPLEVDDEYWENEDPHLAFQQPEGKPAIVTAFVYWAKLSRISAFVLRTLYALGRSKQPLGLVGPRWREETLSLLNGAMLEWIDSLPSHLKWSTTMEDDIFTSQSALLHMSYYLVQISIYRPFIPVPHMQSAERHGHRQQAPDKLSALSICASAAKAGTHILEVLLHKGFPRNTVVVHYAFVYAGVLVVNLWNQIAKEGRHEAWRTRVPSAEMLPAVEAQTKELLQLINLLDNMRPRWELAREASDTIKESLPPFLLPELDSTSSTEKSTRNGTDDQPEQTALPFRFVSSERSYDARGQHGYTPTDLPSSLNPSSSRIFGHSMAHDDVPSSYEDLSHLWNMHDFPASARRSSFIIPEEYSSQDDWAPFEPRLSMQHSRSIPYFHPSHRAPASGVGYQARSYLDISRQPTDGASSHDMRTSCTGVGGSNISNSQASVKRERVDDAAIQLLQDSYLYASLHSRPVLSPELGSVHRPAGLPTLQEQPESWERSRHL
ncbi:hypothetical protein WOLCODRAFT_138497 [Wolfiporia cocos MD-104 SS10]|uniref:Zn(2)-C6 fungal-type domain-containing protein n=1 Tax=Wolfiporia cocos (strain MD-104) TaxID=742152 RepID=A0A2H3JXL8_WOLCO|nr:hypothetical protein WOLCODRAFT_138497 [Wolfiporia cocos MD-104 SS10]